MATKNPPIPTTEAYSTRTETVNAIDVQMPVESSFVVGLPHSGLYLPCDFPASFILHPSLEDDTDIGAENIFSLSNSGGVIIKSNIHRNALDLNRHNKTGREKTVFNRHNRLGRPKYVPIPNVAPSQHRRKRPFYPSMYAKYYVPFYDRVKHELDCLHKRLGYAFLISGHTFRSKKRGMPDICLGTGDGENIDEEITAVFQRELNAWKGLKCKVQVDFPFKGDDGISGLFGKRLGPGYNALLVEVHRRLFVGRSGIDASKIKTIRDCIASAVEHAVQALDSRTTAN